MGTGERPDGAGYALAMSDEVHDWLADLRDGDPLIAGYVIQALTALMKQGASLADPLVSSTEDAWPSALADELDRHYRQMLEDLQPVRRLVVESDDAATRERLIRLNARADAFRARKEVLKARYVAAHSTLMIHQSIDVAGLAGDDAEPQGDGDAEAGSGMEAHLRDAVAKMERELGQQGWPSGLMELRPGAPGDIGVRVLFAVEPRGTALLLSAIEGSEAVKDHYGQAIVLSADILRRVRAGQEPEASARGYPDARSFLDEFQPDDLGASDD
ncbi:MAG TPA: hypothetical protein VEV63_16890 [Streptosporangiaceae bacterium]|nr:hypothetical protein [Streptosporangiaceae bacterium]